MSAIDNHCGLLIKQIHDIMEKQGNNALRGQNLTFSQASVLMAINEAESKILTMKELESKMNVAQSTVAGIVMRLEKKKLVEGFGDPMDKRIKKVRLTSEGRNFCDISRTNMADAERYLLSGLNDDEKEQFRSLLIKIINKLK
ncbi:MAG: MarR family transcriptional regulator [Clostridia bacterium]|nr:MarR family transcriptional regulator [Clostridia bacterium]